MVSWIADGPHMLYVVCLVEEILIYDSYVEIIPD